MFKRKLKTAVSQRNPPVYDNQVTLGSNREARQVVMVFGDPTAEPPNFVAFAPEAARGLAEALLAECDKAEGKAS